MVQDTADAFGLPKAAGALVNSVEKGGPADKAGLESGDIIIKAEGKTVNTSSELPRIITLVKPGTKITLPDPSTFTTAKAQQPAARQEASVDAAKEYRVEQGDSLHKIAMKLYGKATMADTLYELNKDKIGDDSSRVKTGMLIKLPQAPTVATSTPHAAR